MTLLMTILKPESVALAHEGETHDKTFETVLQEVFKKYDADTIQDLDCRAITDQDFELIGDAWMEKIHPGEAHKQMDQMMGGEGSESLEKMHFAMGSNYLGCSDYAEMIGSSSMMGGMMNSGYMQQKNASSPVSPYTVKYNLNSYLQTLILITLFAFLSSGTYYFVKKSKEVSKK